MKLKPTEKQLKFLDWEYGGFIHFGIRSFYIDNSDWDGKEMDIEKFNPTELDCEQWVRSYKEAGMKYCILTTKHHDGFANWPSAYTEYSVKNTPWKNGKGDVVKEFTDACRKYGMGVGLYYSPAQWGHSGAEFKAGKDYDDYFINQISELLSNYGKIDYLWFDGNGSAGHTYDRNRIIKAIRDLQPDILIFNMWDPDTEWVGNEDGYAPIGCFNEQDGKFLPKECDTKLQETWFHGRTEPKSLDVLMGMYYMSIGRGTNLLLNVGPDERGLLPENEVARLMEFYNEVKRRFSSPIEGSFDALSDTKFKIRFAHQPVNHVVLSEDLTEGESVRSFNIYSGNVLVYQGQNVGHKAICRFPTTITGSVTVEITDSNGEFKLNDIKLYYAAD